MDAQRAREPEWRTTGEEPDYRFTLANERTFLAWIRTALAVLAAGVLLDQFSTKLRPHLLVVLVASALCLLAAMLSVMAYRRWQHNEIAMRHKSPLPHSRVLAWLAGAVLATSAALAVLITASIIGIQS
ncbi:DUF202 domain-containing protein [Variovorax sp. CYS-02]|uniref:DUF202 domain-containing protein n=2 Tax=Variovorax terrae TaxID=2923278 RepID=A0A9X2ARZ0_9BURK|nr:DUF202 domain-containing protein [Variovorax terrae]MCJ0764676.1 DUF202 domain-containing protein [Variovorax terrae]